MQARGIAADHVDHAEARYVGTDRIPEGVRRGLQFVERDAGFDAHGRHAFEGRDGRIDAVQILGGDLVAIRAGDVGAAVAFADDADATPAADDLPHGALRFGDRARAVDVGALAVVGLAVVASHHGVLVGAVLGAVRLVLAPERLADTVVAVAGERRERRAELRVGAVGHTHREREERRDDVRRFVFEHRWMPDVEGAMGHGVLPAAGDVTRYLS